MEKVEFEYLPVGTKLYSSSDSKIYELEILRVNIEYRVSSDNKKPLCLKYVAYAAGFRDEIYIDSSRINKTYFTSKTDLIKHLVEQVN